MLFCKSTTKVLKLQLRFLPIMKLQGLTLHQLMILVTKVRQLLKQVTLWILAMLQTVLPTLCFVEMEFLRHLKRCITLLM